VASGNDSSKSTNSKMSNGTSGSTRKQSLDNEASQSVGRSSNGGGTGSNERVLKLKINKSKGSKLEKNILGASGQDASKNQKIIAQI